MLGVGGASVVKGLPAFDAFSSSTGTGSRSWTHTPVGTATGVVVHVIARHDANITGITYGGQALAEVTGSPNTKASGEIMGIYTYFLGTGLPAGAQTVAVTLAPSVNAVSAGSTTVTTDTGADTEIVDTDATINSDSVSNPSATLNLGVRKCFVNMGFNSGQDATSGVTELAGWTASAEYDPGTRVGGDYRYDTVSNGDVTIGWTQTADDALAIGVAIGGT